jgi:Zn-dependent peptidase ImmA (M78 family)
VVKPDDSTLTAQSQRAVEERARKILDRAAAWGRFPTPVSDIVAAAKLRVAPSSIFDLKNILAYAQEKAGDVARTVKRAISKVFGAYDSDDLVIHIDESVAEVKQNFLKLHETGHHEMPTHRKMFRFFQDCDRTLSPEIADQFEREANNFARYALFQGDGFQRQAADSALSLKVPLRLAKSFGASVYASAREYARTHHKACVVYVLEPVELVVGAAPKASVRRIEPSPSFRSRFGMPQDTLIGPGHVLHKILPIGRKMTRPTVIVASDLNGLTHEFVAEAFDTTRNVLILVYPVRELTSATIVAPDTVSAHTAR